MIGPCSVHDPKAAIEYANKLIAVRDRAQGRPADRDACLFRETTDHGRLEGPDQRPGPRRELPDQQGPEPRARAAAADQQHGAACGHRVSRPDQPAVRRGSDQLGCDRCTHHREPGPPRAGLGPFLPGRVQEQYGRQHGDRGRRHACGRTTARVPVADQGGSFGDLQHPRQSRHPCDPARRRTSQLRQGIGGRGH